MTNTVKGDSKSFVSQIVGPISLICTLFLAGKAIAIPNYDLTFVSVVGLYFCAKWRIKGCLFALSLLALSAAGKHLLYTDHHIWQGGFELSVAIALVITTLVFHESAKYVDGVKAQNLAQSQTIEFLEEDLTRVKSLAAEESLVASDKIIQLQSQLDEALTESSSYQILNDVLRKSTARAVDEKERLVSLVFQADRRSGQLLSEIDVLQKELARIGDESSVVQQNGQLFSELNEARVKEAQTQIANDTLARLYQTESGRIQELESKLHKATQELEKNIPLLEELHFKLAEHSAASQRQLQSHNERTQQIETELAQAQTLYFTAAEQLAEMQPQYLQLGAEVNALEVELEQRKALFLTTTEELAQMQMLNNQLSETKSALEAELDEVKQQLFLAPPSITAEREDFLVEQIASFQAQFESLSVKASRADTLQEQLETLQTRLAQYTELELLYRQLKGNFQEKTQVLHETRVQLFHVDTELQTLKQKIEESHLEGEPLIPEMTAEIEEMAQENKALNQENSLLSELITQLMSPPHESHVHLSDAVHAEFNQLADVGLVKKKVKKSQVPSDQPDLFLDELH